MPWRRKWHPTSVFLPGESHGQRSLAGYSPWGQERAGHNNDNSLQMSGTMGLKSSDKFTSFNIK